jgi:hypothetical protein
MCVYFQPIACYQVANSLAAGDKNKVARLVACGYEMIFMDKWSCM